MPSRKVSLYVYVGQAFEGIFSGQGVLESGKGLMGEKYVAQNVFDHVFKGQCFLVDDDGHFCAGTILSAFASFAPGNDPPHAEGRTLRLASRPLALGWA